MATKEELQAQADAEIEAAKPMYKQVNNERMELSDADYDQAKIDLGNSKWEQQQYGYIQARQEAYGSIADQLDMQYWDSVNDTTTWKDHIANVKATIAAPGTIAEFVADPKKIQLEGRASWDPWVDNWSP